MTARVLVVDDVAANVKLMEARLSAEYFDVVTASNGQQALAVCERAGCDLVLLDVMMPGMDGPTTFRELRKNPATAKIPVLLLTAKVQSSDQRRFADLGVEAVLLKPFDPLTLADQISSVLGWS
jgi:two-component system cell cycle response regulator